MVERTLVIGDVHGHADRLQALLDKAEVVKGETRIIQLGDLGQFDLESRENDLLCYKIAYDYNMTVLWGNHDRASFSRAHLFSGYYPPLPATRELIVKIEPTCAASVGNVLITHAGLHPLLADQFTIPDTAAAAAQEINELEGTLLTDAISRKRGGYSTHGGILWRDAMEPLWDKCVQVFGHTAAPVIRTYPSEKGLSFCIDVGAKSGEDLVGVWLPDFTVVAVGPTPQAYEDPDTWVDGTLDIRNHPKFRRG